MKNNALRLQGSIFLAVMRGRVEEESLKIYAQGIDVS